MCGGVFLWFSLSLFSWAEGVLSKHNVDCSRASQEMPQLQITDQAKHVWRWALRGINSPPFPPSALTPATTFITGRENIVSGPLTNTCQFQEQELLPSAVEGKQSISQTLRQRMERNDKRHPSPLSLSPLFSPSYLFLRLWSAVSLWPLGAALPLIWLLTTQV